jgi:hypothetical protein
MDNLNTLKHNAIVTAVDHIQALRATMQGNDVFDFNPERNKLKSIKQGFPSLSFRNVIPLHLAILSFWGNS